MTYETAISALDAAQTGDELIRVLDTLDRALTRADYFMNEALTLGHHRQNVATLEPMEF
jgi:hypothetical protein